MFFVVLADSEVLVDAAVVSLDDDFVDDVVDDVVVGLVTELLFVLLLLIVLVCRVHNLDNCSSVIE